MNQKNHSELSRDEFNHLVAFFAWLKSVRDKNSTQVDALEPLNELNSCVDEVQGSLEGNHER